MTFTLTEQCLFCGKSRMVGVVDRESEHDDRDEAWTTMLSVFNTGHGRQRLGGGTVVTVCRECRPKHTVADLIVRAREVW